MELIRFFRWNRTSYLLLSLFGLTIFTIMVVWWPLVADYAATVDPRYPLWRQLDYLLLGIFAAMSLLIMARPDLKADLRIIGIGFVGGLVIESWGTQTALWTYYTHERPPLWIIPAWPVASLAIDRLYRLLARALPGKAGNDHKPGSRPLAAAKAGVLALRKSARPMDALDGLYWLVFGSFYALMLVFVWPTLDKSLTLGALALCALLILSPGDRHAAVLTFVAGAGLGYFLELWGTTRECWTYYTGETPPIFAVYAHGMAAVAFWRTGTLLEQWGPRLAALAARRRSPGAPAPLSRKEG